MTIPMVNLSRLLEATAQAWQANLSRLWQQSVFILGEQNREFEREFATACDAREAITVGTGTAAIELALRELGIGSPKQEVIAPALTAPFTGTAIATAGASLRFADVDPETLLLNLDDLESRLTKRTAAVVPVHLYGQPCDMPRLRAMARRRGFQIVQDACQAHGARSHGKPLTAYSRHVAYSFYPTKNLGALGDGGAIVTNSAVAARRLRMLRDGGRGKERQAQVALIRGINSRLDEIQACYLRAFLPQLDAWNAQRRQLAALYRQLLADCPGVRLVKTSPESVNHLFVIRAKRRDRLREHLAKRGIATGVHYPVPLHLMPAFRAGGLRRGDLPVAEKAAREVVSLPLWPYMEPAQVEQVANAVRSFYVG